MLKLICFDADDTLWHNEKYFAETQQYFFKAVEQFATQAEAEALLLKIERKNLPAYGYGIKGFMLSLIETALELSQHKISQDVIAEILRRGQSMLSHPVEIFPHVEEVLRSLKPHYKLALLTKGDLSDQERKIKASGLAQMFDFIEVMSDKTALHYRAILEKHGAAPATSVMVGNSLRSDILPFLEIGAFAFYIPQVLAWVHEAAAEPPVSLRFRKLESIAAVPNLLAEISSA